MRREVGSTTLAKRSAQVELDAQGARHRAVDHQTFVSRASVVGISDLNVIGDAWPSSDRASTP